MSENTTLQCTVCTLHYSNVQYIKVVKYKTTLSLYILINQLFIHVQYRAKSNKNMQHFRKTILQITNIQKHSIIWSIKTPNIKSKFRLTEASHFNPNNGYLMPFIEGQLTVWKDNFTIHLSISIFQTNQLKQNRTEFIYINY